MNDATQAQGLGVLDLLVPLAERWRLLIAGPLLAGSVALGITFAIAPTYTGRTTFLAPQQQQNSAATALASLGALSGLAGAAVGGIRAPADQYASLLQSRAVQDRLIDEFRLLDVYQVDSKTDAREALDGNVRVSVGKKD